MLLTKPGHLKEKGPDLEKNLLSYPNGLEVGSDKKVMPD